MMRKYDVVIYGNAYAKTENFFLIFIYFSLLWCNNFLDFLNLI